MADKSAQSVSYLPPTDPAAQEANRVYQEALKKLNESLDLRKNRTFDPVWLAAAQGFFAPTKTGSFWESLGNVAGGLGTAQEQRIKEQQEEAQQRLGVASAGLELERLKQRDRAIGQFLGEGQTTLGMQGGLPAGAPTAGGPSAPSGAPSVGLPAAPSGALSAVPSGAPSAVPSGAAPAQGGLPPQKPAGFEEVQGIQTMPPNKDYISGRQYIALNRYEKGKAFPDLLKEAQKMDQDRYQIKEGGVQDLSTGMFYPFPKGEQVERQLYGNTYKVDSKTAALLDMYAANNDPKYHQLAKRVLEGPPREKPAGGEKPGEEPTGRVSEEELRRREKEAESYASKRATTAAERADKIDSNMSTASNIHGIAGRVNNYLNESGNYFGIFQRPSLISAIGNLVSQGIQTPGGGTINIPALQAAVTQALPGAKQSDIDNLQKAANDLAELELLFTRTYLSGQGQVTEGERRIVSRVSGNVSSSPEVLRTRMNLLRERAQYDMDLGQAWRDYQDKYPAKTFLQFERSGEYKEINKAFQERLAEMEGRLPSLPSQKKSSGKKNNSTARSTLDGLLK